MAHSSQSHPLANTTSAPSSITTPNPPLEIPPPVEDESFNYQKTMAVAGRRAWLILIVFVAVTGTIWTRTLTQPPRYRSSFRLLVEPIAGDQKFQELSDQLGLQQQSGTLNRLDYPTQIQVLQSSQVMVPIYEQLKAEYPNLSYGRLLENLRIQRLGETKILQVSYESENPERAGAVTQVIAEAYIDYSEKQQKSGEQRVLDLIGEQMPTLQEKVESIQSEIQTFRNQNNIIDPVARGNLLSQRISDIEQRKREAEIAITEKLSLRENLLQQLGLGLDEAMTTVALSEAPRYQELLNQLKEIETQIAIELGRFKADSPNIQALKQQKQKILELLEQEASAVLGTSQVSDKINSQVSSPNPIRLALTQDLIAATNEIRVLRVRRTALAEAEAEFRQQLKDSTELAKEYEEMNQRLEIAQGNLKRFIDRREQLKIQAVQKTLPWQVLEPPNQPNQPITGNTRGLILGVIAGLLAGAGAAYLAEKIDNTFHSPDEVKERSRLPILAVIPFVKALQAMKDEHEEFDVLSPSYGNAKAETEAQPQLHGAEKKEPQAPITENFFFAFTEAFKTLHINLSFMKPDQAVTSLVISSCVPGEGKSTVALNLARAAATVGKRVLLVDADLRRPKLHQIFELPNQYGLSNVISTGLSFEEAMQESPTDENLYLLTSGPTPPDSNRLLASERMKQLAAEWENTFDLVIYDTPPLGGVADAKFLTPLTSGLIMVVGLGIIDRNLFKDVMETLRLSKTTVLGIVPNACKQSTMGEYSYYYHYYHQYYSRGNSSQPSLISSNKNHNSASE